MKFADDAFPKWMALTSRAFGTDYQQIMSLVERLADYLETEETAFEDFPAFLSQQEKARGFILSVQDIGEIFVLLGNYWREGEEFIESLGYVEQKLVAENIEHRLAVLAQSAEEKGK